MEQRFHLQCSKSQNYRALRFGGLAKVSGLSSLLREGPALNSELGQHKTSAVLEEEEKLIALSSWKRLPN